MVCCSKRQVLFELLLDKLHCKASMNHRYLGLYCIFPIPGMDGVFILSLYCSFIICNSERLWYHYFSSSGCTCEVCDTKGYSREVMSGTKNVMWSRYTPFYSWIRRFVQKNLYFLQYMYFIYGIHYTHRVYMH